MRTPAEYDASARAAIRSGKRFTYVDPDTGRPRVGYFAVMSSKFTALSAGEREILTHFVATRRYVRDLPSSTYQ
jgi:hypothetical protein